VIFAVLFLVFVALVLLLQGGAARKNAEVLYSDTGAEAVPAEPLRSERYRLIGKPDYLLRKKKQLIPIEVKKHACPASGVPYRSEQLQLAANCLLVEEAYETPVRYGELHYGDGRVLRVSFDKALRRELMDMLEEIEQAEIGKQRRSHSERSRCAGCAFRGRCGEELE
jgi:CRISPR-associated exonuclease Cas4